MKNIFFIFGFLWCTFTNAQTDKNGNPVFNSINTHEEPLGQHLLISNYYTLKFNIENKGSSVFIAEKPTLKEIINAAINLPSDFFFLTKDQKMGTMIMFNTFPQKMLIVMDMSGNKPKEIAVRLTGDITENRANEIIKEKYDPDASIKNGVLYFNKKEYQIIPSKAIKNAVLDIIESEKLRDHPVSEMRYLSKNEIKEVLLLGSKEGGEFDFFTPIKGKEYDGVQVKPGVFTTKSGVALYQWGRASYELGVETFEDAYAIYTEFKGRDLNEKEKAYIKSGFEKAWE